MSIISPIEEDAEAFDALELALTLDAKIMLLVFKLAKEPSDSLIFFRDAEFEELTTLLKKLDFSKISTHPIYDLEASLLGTKPNDQIAKTNFWIILVKIGL